MADETKKARTQAQIVKLEKLQDLILDNFIESMENHTATATDRATLIRWLKSEGWSLDPATVPTDLKDKLTNLVRFDQDLDPAETGERKLKLS